MSFITAIIATRPAVCSVCWRPSRLPGFENVSEEASDAPSVFSLMETGDIDTKVILENAKGGNLLVTNKTDKPLRIRLPRTFAAVPVVRHFGGGMGIGGGGGSQAAGGGFGGGLGGGDLFNVLSGKTAKVKFQSACLEHGKSDPNLRIPYHLVAIESLTADDRVASLVEAVASGQIDQPSAQTATWHFADGLSWNELANKIGAKHLDGSTETFFTPDQIDRGLGFARAVTTKWSTTF